MAPPTSREFQDVQCEILRFNSNQKVSRPVELYSFFCFVFCFLLILNLGFSHAAALFMV